MFDEVILRFFRDDIGGILITDKNGDILYEDQKTAFIRTGKTNWRAACPPAAPDQKGEMWDFPHSDSGRTYLVTTSTFDDHGDPKQIHHLVDISVYMNLSREITDYSKQLKAEREHDGLTGLYNKRKFLELKRTLFRHQETIAVFNMDVNNLKHVNDTYGHDAGDRLIKKAAESLKRIEARNVLPFRMGGDEFVVAAIHVSLEDAEKIKQTWEQELAALNEAEDGLPCVIACGFAFGEKGYDLDEVFACADERMYEDKKEKKRKAGQPLTR